MSRTRRAEQGGLNRAIEFGKEATTTGVRSKRRRAQAPLAPLSAGVHPLVGRVRSWEGVGPLQSNRAIGRRTPNADLLA